METTQPVEPAIRIAELNDRYRHHIGLPDLPAHCKIITTQGVAARFPADALDKVLGRVKWFDTFTGDNDPWSEHDFGAFDLDGERMFWKFDYYTIDMEAGSEHPENEPDTMRVLTIMLASEY